MKDNGVNNRNRGGTGYADSGTWDEEPEKKTCLRSEFRSAGTIKERTAVRSVLPGRSAELLISKSLVDDKRKLNGDGRPESYGNANASSSDFCHVPPAEKTTYCFPSCR